MLMAEQSLVTLHLIAESGSSTEPGAWHLSKADWQECSADLNVSQHWESQVHVTRPCFHMVAMKLNLGPYDCGIRALSCFVWGGIYKYLMN